MRSDSHRGARHPRGTQWHILQTVQPFRLFLFPFCFLIVCVFFAGRQLAAQQSPQSAPPPAASSAPAQSTPQHLPIVVVLDPGHGGTDTGARGATGAEEKDFTLAMARATRAELQQQGFHVVLTRDTDDNPSFDDRAAAANAPRWAIFVSFHVSSTGKVGTARAYSYPLSNLAPPAFSAASVTTPPPRATPAPVQAPVHLVKWDEAQQPFTDASHKLADLVQSELTHAFPASPAVSAEVPIRDLRSVAAPAIAVELSSVTVQDPASLNAMIPPLSAAVARGIADYRPIFEAGAH